MPGTVLSKMVNSVRLYSKQCTDKSVYRQMCRIQMQVAASVRAREGGGEGLVLWGPVVDRVVREGLCKVTFGQRLQ